MNKHHQFASTFTLVAAALMLGGCLGAEPETDASDPEALEAQGEPALVAPEQAPPLELQGAVKITPKLAAFEGQTIDISTSRGDARACLILDEDTVECFRTEEEAAARMAELEDPSGPADPERLASNPPQDLLCSSFVCLYQHSNYGGDYVCLRERRVEIDLGPWGFDNRMSSYDIGGCNVTFWSGASNTGDKFVAYAWTSSSYVGSTWNDRVSSIWIW